VKSNLDPDLSQIAITIVAARQPCSPYTLLDRLKNDFGASTAQANTTMLTLIRDGQIRRTSDGRLVLPGYGGGGMSTMNKIVLAVFLLAIAAFMVWVISNMLA
jgi:hypothetical protein